MRIFSYSRVSTGTQTTGSGIDRQLDAARAYAESQGGVLDSELSLSDAGVSAYKGNHLKGALGAFLKKAQSGALGDDPHLVCEDIDRLSRLEPLDGLMDVLLALVRAGVTIHTTIDGQTYNRERLQTDASSLLVLVVKTQAAHDYSKRLSHRIAGAHARKRQAIADGERPKAGPIPAWITHTADGYVLNPHSATIARMFELSELGWGGSRIAKYLNENGLKPTKSRMWTSMSVNDTMRRPQVYGGLRHRTGERGIDGKPMYQTTDDYYPAAVSKERWLAATHRRESACGGRGSFKQVKSFHWIGQGITTCALCGNTCGVNSGSDNKGGRMRYVRCRTPGCNTRGFNLKKATPYLLDRLTGRALAMLTTAPVDVSEVDREISQALVAVQAATERLENAEAKALEAVTADVGIATLELLTQGTAAARKTKEDVQSSYNALVARKMTLMSSAPTPDTAGLQLENPEQRQAFNDALIRWGLHITINPDTNKWGLTLPGRPTVWATFGPDWWTDFGWIGPPDESPPPAWITTEAEELELAYLRRQVESQ